MAAKKKAKTPQRKSKGQKTASRGKRSAADQAQLDLVASAEEQDGDAKVESAAKTSKRTAKKKK